MVKVTTIEIIGETNQKPTKKKAHAEMRRMSLLLNSNRYCWIEFLKELCQTQSQLDYFIQKSSL